MTRRTKDITITEEGRDKGSVFRITEWPASKAEDWANRAILAIGRHNPDVKHLVGTGMAGLFILGFEQLFKIDEPTCRALLAEMMECVKVVLSKVPDGRALIQDGTDAEDIKEVRTRWFLKMEVFFIHTGFSWAEVKSRLISAASIAATAITQTTSAKTSRKSSQRTKRRSRN